MAQSAEYPDLTWMPPRSWTNADRTSVQLVVIHDTEGSEGITSAEDGAAYDQRRTDGTSTHYFHDQDSTVQCVRTEDIAHAARTQGNRRGIQHEICGRAGQGAAGWADAASRGAIDQCARQVARDCRKWDIPARRLTPAQVAAGQKGICGHVDITAAFPQDNGDHTDPGPTFPWETFIGLVNDYLSGDEQMALSDEVMPVGETFAKELLPRNADGSLRKTASFIEVLQLTGIWSRRSAASASTATAALNALAARPDVNNAAIAAALAPTLAPAVAAAVAALVDVDVTGVVIEQAKLEAALRTVLGSVDNR